MFVSILAPLALASVALATAAPPNPDKMFALQEKAAVAAGAVKSSAHSAAVTIESAAKHTDKRRGIDWKEGFKGQGRAHLLPVGGFKRHNKRFMSDDSLHHRLARRQQAGAHSLDSSKSAVDDSDLEARATQYAFDASNNSKGNSVSSVKASASASANQSKQSQAATAASTDTGPDVGGAWSGVSSYYLYAMADDDRAQVLDAVKGAGFKVIRIFVAYVGHGNKGSNSYEVPDLEPNEVGTYDDTVLYKIDQLMYECKQRGLKLLIALSDRYALGYWSTDRYALQLNIVKAGTSGVQRVANAASFYTNAWAIKMFDQRLTHILQHKNDKLGGRTWAQLDDVVYAYEPQNEPQGHMPMASDSWSCDRAKHLKQLLSGSSIKISSGGGITTTDSLGSWAMNCDSFDIVSVHDYGTSAWTTAGALDDARSKTNKEVIMGEWGIAGPNKAQIIGEFVSAFKSKGLPWMYWQITKPGQCAQDFEVWTDEPAWTALTGQPATGNACQWKDAPKPTTTTQWSQTTQSWNLPASSSKKDDENQTKTWQQQQTWSQTWSAAQPQETWKDDGKQGSNKNDKQGWNDDNQGSNDGKKNSDDQGKKDWNQNNTNSGNGGGDNKSQ
ncbi:hypothetical protein OIV83_006291 [Microbotryomycetes sp. JL201]|nr:hypothetical protein OIV83_006291 [Microbotryomycetes sp. JL201]